MSRRLKYGTVLILMSAVGCRPTAHWTADGSRIAAEMTASIEFINVRDGATTSLAFTSGRPVGFRWHPDGQRFTYYRLRESGRGRYVIDLEMKSSLAGTPRVIHRGMELDTEGLYSLNVVRGVLSSEWSPDGRSLAYSFVKRNRVVLAVYSEGKGVRFVGRRDGSLLNPTWSPDSQTVAFRHIAYPPRSGPEWPPKVRGWIGTFDLRTGSVKRVWNGSAIMGLDATCTLLSWGRGARAGKLHFVAWSEASRQLHHWFVSAGVRGGRPVFSRLKEVSPHTLAFDADAGLLLGLPNGKERPVVVGSTPYQARGGETGVLQLALPGTEIPEWDDVPVLSLAPRRRFAVSFTAGDKGVIIVGQAGGKGSVDRVLTLGAAGEVVH